MLVVVPFLLFHNETILSIVPVPSIKLAITHFHLTISPHCIGSIQYGQIVFIIW